MSISKFVFAAAALTLASGAALADANPARHAGVSIVPMAMEHSVERRTNAFGGAASKPTIFGHAVGTAVYQFSDDRNYSNN